MTFHFALAKSGACSSALLPMYLLVYNHGTMDIRQFDEWARTLLSIDAFAKADNSLNGLQVGCLDAPLHTVAFAVDASLETIRRARERGAQALFVHHGLLWGRQERLTGTMYGRLRELIAADMALYACHLPLDAHPEVGNNAVLARLLALQAVEPFGEYHGAMIGCKGVLPEPLSMETIRHRLLGDGSAILAVLPFGPKLMRSVGIISGGAAYDVSQAIDQSLDLYVTGECTHSIYHNVMEAGINMLSVGHYASEVHGVKALAERASLELGLESFFVDCPTGL